MQRIMKNPDEIVDDMLRGFLKAHSGLVEKTSNPRVVKARNIQPGKVGVVTGGGSGHKPAFIGYVGRNLCDAAAVGAVSYTHLDVYKRQVCQRTRNRNPIIGRCTTA